jgi:hypothetical protein
MLHERYYMGISDPSPSTRIGVPVSRRQKDHVIDVIWGISIGFLVARLLGLIAGSP